MKILTASNVLETVDDFSLQLTSTGDIKLSPKQATNDVHGGPYDNFFSPASCSYRWTKITTPHTCSRLSEFKTPQIDLDHIQLLKTIRTPNLPALLNFGLNHPVTPRTPMSWRGLDVTARTPCLSQNFAHANDNFIIQTPMIYSSLSSLKTNTYLNTLGPDIIELIDDENKDVNCLNRQISTYNDIELDDNNVIDYVLTITENVKPRLATDSVQTKIDTETEFERRVRRRKGRHAKRMTEDEARSYRESQRKKAKERRKERKNKFTWEEKGITRRSKRSSTRKKISYR